MSTVSAPATYNFISRLNHWSLALAMIGMILFGFYVFEFMPDGPEKGPLVGLHKAIGVIVLIFGVWRVGYRLAQGVVAEPASMPKWQKMVAKLVHIILLGGILLMPLSGVVGSYFGARAVDVFGLFTIPAGPEVKPLAEVAYALHGLGAWLFVGAVVLHLLGALAHHFIDRDDTLKRMLGTA